jgi:hypothetical protein
MANALQGVEPETRRILRFSVKALSARGCASQALVSACGSTTCGATFSGLFFVRGRIVVIEQAFPSSPRPERVDSSGAHVLDVPDLAVRILYNRWHKVVR